MSGNHATRRKAGRAKLLASYRADGRFSSLSAFIENERLAVALRGERSSASTFRPFPTKKWTLVIDDSFNKAMHTAASFSLEDWQKQILASAQLPAEQFKGMSNVSISSISPKR